MNNLSFHITDIAANSIRAKASVLSIDIQDLNQTITIHITDNGCGMDADVVSKIRDPFYTTRTTRKVGLGLPFLIQNAEQTGGYVEIKSEPQKGTSIIAHFIASDIDCPPWGDLAGTMALLIGGNPDIYIHFSYQTSNNSFSFNTFELKEVLDGIPLNQPKVILILKEMISENI